MRCPSCSFESPAGFRFCGGCGSPLAPPTTSPSDDAERRQVTVVFVDLVESTALAELLDPEELREIVAAYQQAVGGIVERFDGHVAQLLGDGVLAYFGYPRAHEDDARRAVQAGLEIVREVERSAPRWRGDRPLRIAVRVGIHSGEVVAGEMGSGRARERLALGETPNVAARLQAAAAPGEVLVSDATAELTRGHFELEPRDERRMRGLSRPIVLHRVLSSLDRSRFEAAMASRRASPHVGRTTELARLHAAFAAAAAGTPRALHLVGEAGIGKSRLVHRFASELEDRPHGWWMLRCSALAQATAFDPVIGWIHRVFATHELDPEALRTRLVAGLAELGVAADRDAAAATLLHLISFDGAAGGTERTQEAVATLLRRLLAAAAERSPVVLVIDDLHWADPSTLELADDLLAAPPADRLLLLLVSRPGGPPVRGGRLGPEVEEIRLERLDDAQARQLVAGLTGGGLPTALEDAVLARTDGVPLFIEELTRAVVESGTVRRIDGRYELADARRALAIPTTLAGSLMARLDRLPAGKALAQLGAVLGRTFTFAMIRAVSGLGEEELDRGLEELVAADLLRGKGRPPRATYWFRHALIQDVAYESLLRRRRRELHGAVATAIVERFPDLAAQRPEELARHLTEAERPGPAADAWLAAGRRAAAASAHREARAHLEQARRALATLPPSPRRDRLELEVLVVLAPCLSAVGGYFNPEAEATFQRLLALAERLGEGERTFWPFYNLVLYHFVGSRLDPALELMTRLAQVVSTSDDPTLLAQAQYGLGSTHYFRGELAAADRHLRRAIELDVADRERSELRHTGLDVGVIARAIAAEAQWQLGDPDAALASAVAGVELARRLEQPVSLTVALLYLAAVRSHRGEPVAARAAAEEQVALAAEQQLFHGCLGAMLLGRLEAIAGDDGDGRGVARLQAGLEAYRAGGRLGSTQYLAWLGEAHLARGERDEARRCLEEGIAAAEGGERFWLPELLRLRGEAEDDPSRAAGYRERAARLAAEHGSRGLADRVASAAPVDR